MDLMMPTMITNGITNLNNVQQKNHAIQQTQTQPEPPERQHNIQSQSDYFNLQQYLDNNEDLPRMASHVDTSRSATPDTVITTGRCSRLKRISKTLYNRVWQLLLFFQKVENKFLAFFVVALLMDPKS